MAKVKCEVSFSGEPRSRFQVLKVIRKYTDMRVGVIVTLINEGLMKGVECRAETESKKRAHDLVVALNKQGLTAFYSYKD